MKSLQSLRGIFAIFIFLHHLNLFEAGGDAGVCFFLVLSGFVMSVGYWDKIRSRKIEYRNFFEKRLLRLYPYHIIGFIIALVLLRPSYGGSTLFVYISNLLMLQSWIPDPKFFFSCDSPSWCLSDFMFCYAMFPFIVRLVENKITHHKRLLGIGIALLIAYFIIINLIPINFQLAFIYINPLFRLLDFCIGMLLWWISFSVVSPISAQMNLNINSKVVNIFELLPILLFIALVSLYQYVPEIYGLASFWWIPVVFLILTFSLTNERKGIISRILSSRPLVWFGEMSFAFYMLHVPLIGGYRILANHLSDLPIYNSLWGIVIIFIITIVLSAAVTEIVIPKLIQGFRSGKKAY